MAIPAVSTWPATPDNFPVDSGTLNNGTPSDATHPNLHRSTYDALNKMQSSFGLVPAPTGIAATDTANLTAALVAPTTDIALPAGTYVFNPTTLTRNHLRYRGVFGQTTVKLAGQGGGAQVALLSMGVSDVLFEDIIFDGNSGTILAGSGNYWNGLIALSAGAYQITFRRCTFQNTARCGVYGIGSAGTQIAGVVFDDCRFTEIGLAGTGNGGAGVMLEQNIHDCEIRNSRAYGRLSSNFLKLKGDSTASQGMAVSDNVLDYSACTTFDATNSALAVELWNGAYRSHCSRNTIYGPNTIPVAGAFWGISFGDARGSEIDANIVQGGTNIQAMTYGIEVAECPSLVVSNNQVSNAAIGSNATNNNPQPSHAISFTGNTWQNCYTNGVTTDSAPSAVKFVGDTFIDCGTRYLFYNSVNTGGGDGTLRDGIVSACTFQIKDQTRLDAEGRIFAIYVNSPDATKTARLTIGDCNFGPYPGGTSTIGLNPLQTNAPRGVTLHHCNLDGARSGLGGGAQADRGVITFNGDFHADHNTAVNFVTEFCALNNPATLAPLSTFEFNNVGALGITSGGANAPYTNIYWDLATGRLHVRNSAGTDAAVGP